VKSFRHNFDNNIDYVLAVFNPEETELLGSTGMHTRLTGNALEIGYWINVRHINKGYATEIVKALVRVGFEIEKLDRLEIHCHPKNVASYKVAEKCNFTLKQTLPADASLNKRDTMIWVLTKEAYELSPLKNFQVKAFNKDGKEILITQ